MSATEKTNAFKQSLQLKQPLPTWPNTLKALWWDAKDQWTKAHDLVDSGTTLEECAVHAYLHRKEGDQYNAAYWYQRAEKAFPKTTLAKEWEALLLAFLKDE